MHELVAQRRGEQVRRVAAGAPPDLGRRAGVAAHRFDLVDTEVPVLRVVHQYDWDASERSDNVNRITPAEVRHRRDADPHEGAHAPAHQARVRGLQQLVDPGLRSLPRPPCRARYRHECVGTTLRGPGRSGVDHGRGGTHRDPDEHEGVAGGHELGGGGDVVILHRAEATLACGPAVAAQFDHDDVGVFRQRMRELDDLGVTAPVPEPRHDEHGHSAGRRAVEADGVQRDPVGTAQIVVHSGRVVGRAEIVAPIGAQRSDRCATRHVRSSPVPSAPLDARAS
jgi:hypothetical protein